ncbi:MAG: type II toxin-antitoxin system VapC family toxin [Gammaproteobacteria bacterium]|nr:type II toxin-antitoxin system VapC family toxin [Gammaproteobacteria bacterium]
MIILDTNVLSELMKPDPQSNVVKWVAGQPASSLFTTFITKAEVLYGLALLADSARKNALELRWNYDYGDTLLFTCLSICITTPLFFRSTTTGWSQATLQFLLQRSERFVAHQRTTDRLALR